MKVVLLPLPSWERGLVDGAFILALPTTFTLSLTLSPQGRGDSLDRSWP